MKALSATLCFGLSKHVGSFLMDATPARRPVDCHSFSWYFGGTGAHLGDAGVGDYSLAGADEHKVRGAVAKCKEEVSVLAIRAGHHRRRLKGPYSASGANSKASALGVHSISCSVTASCSTCMFVFRLALPSSNTHITQTQRHPAAPTRRRRPLSRYLTPTAR